MAYSPEKSSDNLFANNFVAQSTNVCKYCKNVGSAFSCCNCGVFYCSTKCQDLDWQYHRFLCRPKPKLVKVSNVEFKIQLQETLRMLANNCLSLASQLEKMEISVNGQNNLIPLTVNGIVEDSIGNSPKSNAYTKDDELVVLTHFDTPNRTILCSKLYYPAYLDVLKIVDDFGKMAPLLQELPVRNQLVITGRNGSFCRAKVLFVKDAELIRVFILDYGYSTTRKFIDLRQISQDIVDLPKYTSICTLKNVENYKLNQEILKNLKQFELKVYKLIYDHSKNEVELFDIISGQCINEIIEKNFKGFDVFKSFKEQINHDSLKIVNVPFKEPLVESVSESVEAKEPVLVAPFKDITFPVTVRNVKALIVNTSLIEYGYMACVLEEHIEQLTDVQELLNCKKSNGSEPYIPICDEYVIANFEGDWLRGKVVEVLSDDQFEICSIDFLNQSTINSQDIRRYPNDLVIDCYTTLCLLSGLPKNCSPKTKEFLKNKIHTWDKIFINRIAYITEDNIAVIECNDIIDRMLEKNVI